ncbi:MAG: hypothetical protein HGJ94_18380 [Desulfosarcina sp.]|nr:hypothetical protein [Desulfosarcina sp.]
MRLNETLFRKGVIRGDHLERRETHHIDWYVYNEAQERLVGMVAVACQNTQATKKWLASSMDITDKPAPLTSAQLKERRKQSSSEFRALIAEKRRRTQLKQEKKFRRRLEWLKRRNKDNHYCCICGVPDQSAYKDVPCSKCRAVEKEFMRPYEEMAKSLAAEAKHRDLRVGMEKALIATAYHDLENKGHPELVETHNTKHEQTAYSLRSVGILDYIVMFRTNQLGDRVARIPIAKFRNWFLKQPETFRPYSNE